MRIRNAASTGRNEVPPGQTYEMSASQVASERKRSKVIDHWFECGDLVEVKAEEQAELDAGLVALAGENLAFVLSGAGYEDVSDVAKATTDNLTKLRGIGKATADDLIERALEAETSGDEE